MGGIGARRMLVGGIARFVKRGGLRTLFAVVALLATACGSPTTLDTPTPAPTGTPPSPNAKAPLTSLAAGQALAFRRLTLDDGLSQSTINCITQDPQGFMWFGTQDGLNRYDGYEFRIYRRDAGNPYSLTNSYIVGCEHDQRGVMWVVTGDGTLHRYEPETDRFIRAKLALDDPFEQRGSEFTFLHGDAQGRVWIGTWGDGLARYDPDEDSFTIYRHDPDDVTSLSHRIVTQIYEGRDGTIWVGTEGGLNRWDPASDSFVRYPYRDFPPDSYQYDPPVHVYDPMLQPDNPHALASPAVTALLEDREGTLWVGTRYGGLNRLDRETDRFTAYSFDPAYEPKDPNTLSGNSVRALLEDHVGHIWVASAHYNLDQTRTMARLGLEQLDPQTGAVTRYRGNPEDPCSLPHDAVMRMYEDRRGILWVHTFAGGVELYDRAGGCFHHQAHDPEDPRTLGDEGITRFYEDASGGLWIGTELGGVSYYDPTWCKFPHYPVSAPGGERLSNNSIWVIAASPPALDAGGRTAALWISTFAGLNYWDRRSNAFTFYELDPELPDTVAHGIYEDASRQRLWLGTTMGLERAGLQSDGATAPKTLDITRVLTRSSASVGYVMDLHSTGDDLLWLAHYRVGLSRFDLETETVVATYQADPDDTDGLFDDRIIDIHPGRGGTLWLVTQSGVEHFDPERETFTHYLHDPQQPDGMAQRVISLYQDEAGNVWLGSDGEGLQRLDPDTGQVTATYHAAHGLPNNVVYSILPDNAGNLWLSTNKGLARFDPETETFRTYTVDDGLQSNEFNMGADFRAPDGELFFGGINGINAFYPQAIGRNEHPPRVVITEITRGALQAPGATAQGGHAASTATEDSVAETAPPMVRQIELTYRDRIVSFAFAALHYTVPEHNAYAYMLEGFDEDWYYVGNRRFATYTNLPPGRYTFRVKAANSDGVWNEEGTAVAVNVKPPFWATWWFRGTLG
ncbi:MAG: hypothetical protein JXC32_15905, partial [Anaerolineae bacterium]|nr:hypothetical protein [Anaerolineae bacterium]